MNDTLCNRPLLPVLLALSLLLLLQPAAAYGNTLVVGIGAEHGNLDPCVGGSPRTTEVVSSIYEQPVGFGIQEIDGYQVQAVDDLNGWKPLLAESVEVGEDGRVYTFHLRRGVRFYPSGNEMTSRDWVWSWRRQLADPPIGWCGFENKEASISDVDEIEALGPYTVRITADRANPRTLPFMRLQMFSILDSQEVQKHTSKEDPWATEWLSQNTAGTGPYFISSREPGQELVLEENPYYWGEKPGYSRMIIKTIKDTSTRLALLARGSIDIATNIPARLAQRLKKNPGVNVLSVPSGNRVYIAFNQAKPPFDNLALRKAIAYAVPYEAVINNVYFGSARRYDSFVLPQVPGYSGANFDYALDLEKAKEWLAESGVDTKRSLLLKISAANPEQQQVALLLQDYLGRIGLQVEIKKIPSADFDAKVFAKELDFFIHQGVSWIDDPSTIVGLWMETDAFGNFTKFSNAEVDRLQKKWQFEPYGPERNAAYRRIQEIYNQELNAIYLVLADHIAVTRSDVAGFVLYKDEGIRYRLLHPVGK